MRCRLPNSYFGNILTNIKICKGGSQHEYKNGEGQVMPALHLGKKKSILIVKI